jgi:hypothetical protein
LERFFGKLKNVAKGQEEALGKKKESLQELEVRVAE